MLGFDNERSTDHFWGPLLNLFLSENDNARWSDQIRQVLAAELPFEVGGFSTTSVHSKEMKRTWVPWATSRPIQSTPSTMG